MSLFKSAKSLISASVNALGSSVELMSDFAYRLEHETRILALRAAVKNLELFERKPQVDPEGRTQIQLRKELFEKYDELINLLGPRDGLEFEERKEALIRTERLEKANVLNSRIAEMELRANKGGYSLPVEEQRALKILVGTYDQLFKLGDFNRTEELAGRYRQLKLDIEALELRRHRVEEVFFSSGRKKSLVRLLDEKKDGVCECWFESGARKARIEFKAGLAHGKCLVWYENGSLELDAMYREGRLWSPASVYSSNGVKMVDFQDNFIGVRMWNGTYLGGYRLGSSIFLAKLIILLRVFFSFKALKGFYRARKGCPDNAFLIELNRAVLTFGSGMTDVSVWVEI